MGLKPEPHTAVLVKERVQEAIQTGRLSESEERAMRDFDRDLEHYLK